MTSHGAGRDASTGSTRLDVEARRRLAADGLHVGRSWVVGGASWASAAAGATGMVEALERAALPGVGVEARGRSFCARTPASPDCLFVSVVSAEASSPAVHEIGPEQVEAVVLVEPAPPTESGVRMLWREELRTGRLLLFLRGWSGNEAGGVPKTSGRSLLFRRSTHREEGGGGP